MTANIECSGNTDTLFKSLDPYCTEYSDEYCEMVVDWSDCHDEYIDAPVKDNSLHSSVFYKEVYVNNLGARFKIDKLGFEATRDEVKGLYESLPLSSAEIMCLDCPRVLGRTADGGEIYTEGRFHLEINPSKIDRVLDMLKDDDFEISAVSEEKREALIEHLETLLETYFEEMVGQKGA
jgi:hypothetical protein